MPVAVVQPALARAYVGVSGWRYPPWRGHFYPPKLAQSRELDYASSRFNSIELNGSFYSLQRPSSYLQWAAQTPADFVFSVKGPRYITHMLRLRNAGDAMANFFASGVLALGRKLGPVLWQFPPNFAYDAPLFEAFLRALPRDHASAVQVASRHDERMRGREWLGPVEALPLRHAVEVRHNSFAQPDFIEQLRNHGVAWVVADTPLPWPLFEDITADFVYLRLHGATELYNSRYSPEEIEGWAARMHAWRSGLPMPPRRLIDPASVPSARPRDVYCYFDNTDKLHAPGNALELTAALERMAAA